MNELNAVYMQRFHKPYYYIYIGKKNKIIYTRGFFVS